MHQAKTVELKIGEAVEKHDKAATSAFGQF